ncbi:ATP-binding protein [Geobacter hydrogenophilus]|uniref:ATPase n=1 Tax=Geobacter hydrogenophilus TaxID=40983 RepID=A0A9W6FXR4_9BACT|nr:ATP-binding protein [Geobacter hydrogenophilus]MBT0894843.1 ATP-binding protein [Geobacter hydrogenophilus]GLI36752.1 ATPase [Geobacter hydrogenophilus]
MDDRDKRWDRIAGKLDYLLGRLDRFLDDYVPPPPPDDQLFECHIAFRWRRVGEGGSFLPVEHPHLPDLNDLVGIDLVRDELVRNTGQFVAGYPANNVLLWGERGTGKSTCVKGLLRRFSEEGLRLVEVLRDDLFTLPAIIGPLRKMPHRFVLFCDDLSFGEGEGGYRELKALLEGGIEERPSNILFYATSNRRHLLPERMEDNLGGEIHPEEAVSEKLSLADRFGLNLSFYSFDQTTYLAIVARYAEKFALPVDPESLRREALQWALFKGSRSGRSARQFVDDLAGRLRVAMPDGMR